MSKNQALWDILARSASHPDCLHFPFFCSTFWQMVFCQHGHWIANPSQHCFLGAVAPAFSQLPRGGLEHPSAHFLLPPSNPTRCTATCLPPFLERDPKSQKGPRCCCLTTVHCFQRTTPLFCT